METGTRDHVLSDANAGEKSRKGRARGVLHERRPPGNPMKREGAVHRLICIAQRDQSRYVEGRSSGSGLDPTPPSRFHVWKPVACTGVLRPLCNVGRTFSPVTAARPRWLFTTLPFSACPHARLDRTHVASTFDGGRLGNGPRRSRRGPLKMLKLRVRGGGCLGRSQRRRRPTARSPVPTTAAAPGAGTGVKEPPNSPRPAANAEPVAVALA